MWPEAEVTQEARPRTRLQRLQGRPSGPGRLPLQIPFLCGQRQCPSPSQPLSRSSPRASHLPLFSDPGSRSLFSHFTDAFVFFLEKQRSVGKRFPAPSTEYYLTSSSPPSLWSMEGRLDSFHGEFLHSDSRVHSSAGCLLPQCLPLCWLFLIRCVGGPTSPCLNKQARGPPHQPFLLPCALLQVIFTFPSSCQLYA